MKYKELIENNKHLKELFNASVYYPNDYKDFLELALNNLDKTSLENALYEKRQEIKSKI